MFTREELQALAEGLDSLARNAKDVLMASAKLLPIRNKLEESIRDAIGKATVKNDTTHEDGSSQ